MDISQKEMLQKKKSQIHKLWKVKLKNKYLKVDKNREQKQEERKIVGNEEMNRR